MYLFVAVLGLHCCTGFPLVAGNGGYTLAAMYSLLTVVASRCKAHAPGHASLNGCSLWAQKLQHAGFRVQTQ